MIISIINKAILFTCGLGLALVFCVALPHLTYAMSYPAGHLIDNYVLLDTSAFSQDPTTSQEAIQAFLVGKNSYLASYSSYSGRDSKNVLASQIISEASQDYGINPQVILATLQKEQSLVTDPSPAQSQLDYAMGYACGDSTGCGSYSGFYNQVDNGTWQLRFDFERANGDSNWGMDAFEQSESYPCNTPSTAPPYSSSNNSNIKFYYPGLMSGNNVTFYDGYGTPYSSFNLANAATAALYCYTPHAYPGSPNDYYSGSQNFEAAFTQWGWPLYSNNCVYENPSSISSTVTFRKFQPNLDSGDLVLYTGTSTNCIESHAWNPGSGFTTWESHVASNLPVTDPADGVVKFADLTGDGIDNPIYIGLNGSFPEGTQSGYVEFHVWTNDMQNWVTHAISNLPICDPADASSNPATCSDPTTPSAQNSSIEFADLVGNGIDEPVAIQYKDTASGFVELWIWDSGLHSWAQHIITNLPDPIDPAKMQIGFADLYGTGKDEAIAFGVSDTTTGMVEFHVWAPGEQSWQTHIVSSLPTSQLVGCSIGFADFSGDGTDYGAAVCTQNTQSGKIEFHIWNPGFTSWQGHYASNQATL